MSLCLSGKRKRKKEIIKKRKIEKEIVQYTLQCEHQISRQ